ncbi:MAG: leucine-rich repeat domain-containing protein [Propionibacteriaceae bacterium]|jgi:Leucine-rich repeat (LRR) protein|nr:leucine-rich repeat domain-containing protein [Propionibacteriaceae bacterium]
MRHRFSAVLLGTALAATAALTLTPAAHADTTASPSPSPNVTASASPSPSATPSPTVNIPDANFRACINTALKQAADATFTVDQLAGIETLTCAGKADDATTWVESLGGAAYLTKLTELQLNNSALATLDPIADLTGLTKLSLVDNHEAGLVDLTPLAKLTKLTSLYLNDARVANLTPLAGLTALKSLVITNTRVADISPLAGLTSLTSLELANNRITSVAALKDLTAVNYLDLRNNQILDVSALAGLTALQAESAVLRLEGNQIIDLSTLGDKFTPYCNADYVCSGGVRATGQTMTLTLPTTSDLTLPVKELAATDGQLKFTFVSGPATLKDDTLTINSEGTIVVTWTSKSKKQTASDYFSGTLTIKVSQPVAASNCGVSGTIPKDGPVGKFLDVTSATPHYAEINWMTKADSAVQATGWSVSCYKTASASSHLVLSGNGYTLAAGAADSAKGYGILTDAQYGSNTTKTESGTVVDNTIGYIFQPAAEVTRSDSSVWLAELALPEALNLEKASDMEAFLAGTFGAVKESDNPVTYSYPYNYAITNDKWTQGADGKWGTDDDATVVTIPYGSPYYAEFTDIAPYFGTEIVDRQSNAVAWLANTVVNAEFDKDGNLIGGQRLSEGWAATSGTTSLWGSGDTWSTAKATARQFLPYSTIVRQDMAAFLYRIALYKEAIGDFKDDGKTSVSKDISGWTAHGEAVKWLYGAGITTGFEDGTFGGLRPVIRQDMAAFVQRTDKWFTT